MTNKFLSSNEDDYAIVLAAGFSTRMGTCKAALPWGNGQTLLSYQVTQLLKVGIKPIVVLGTHNLQHQAELEQAQVVLNPEPSRGKTSSILAGLAAVPDEARSLMISAVDQPRSVTVYVRLLEMHHQATAPITAPVYQERMGHPLLFSPMLLPDLMQISEQTLGLRRIVQHHYEQIQKVKFATSEVLSDLNTPERYRSQQVTEATSETTLM